jgi:hypothetical protein
VNGDELVDQDERRRDEQGELIGLIEGEVLRDDFADDDGRSW